MTQDPIAPAPGHQVVVAPPIGDIDPVGVAPATKVSRPHLPPRPE